ncbi:HAD-IA family hydrolase [Pseudonocardia sp. GCM10023141]|uniref:HAD-IA family hydrolase n=1 Tax=Pseudonocardia sp. GCM10023141 TaxID=3252653 RepID=UPI0036236E37
MERTVVFDLGDVLVPSTGVLPVIAAALDVDVATLAGAYWPPRVPYDLGGSPQAYWTAVVTALGRVPDPELLRRLEELDSASWSAPSAAALVLLADLAADGVRLGLLSNAPAPLATAVRAAHWSARFAHLVFSADLALVKPDPAIYAAADGVYGTARGDVVFFDDRADNVAAARAHGWDAHLWTGVATARDALDR